MSRVQRITGVSFWRPRGVLGKMTTVFLTSLPHPFLLTAVFGLLIADSAMLALERTNYATQGAIAWAIVGLLAVIVVGSVVHLIVARFDTNNRRSRYFIHLPLIVIALGIMALGIVWGLDAASEVYPLPGHLPYSISGFVCAFVAAFSIYYQAQLLRRLFT